MQTMRDSMQALAKQLGVEILPYEPSLFDLQRCEATATVQASLDAKRAALAKHLAAGVDARARSVARYRTAIEADERALAACVRRDAIQDERPDGCWCLGAGGRHEAFLPPYDREAEPVPVLREYCPCPDGAARRAADDAARKALPARLVAMRTERLWKAVGGLEEYRDWTLEQFPNAGLVARVRGWLTALSNPNGARWLVLHGKFGRGKTTLAVSLAREFIAAGQAVIFATVADVLSEIRATYDSPDRAPRPFAEGEDRRTTESDLLRSLREVDVLVLDDLGAERMTGWVEERLYLLLNDRHNHRRPVIVTTNLTPATMPEHVGERIFERFKRHAAFVLVDGRNLRDRRAS